MKNQKGFTLLELILTISLISVFITAITYFSVDIFKARTKAITVAETQQNARFALQKIAYHVRNSENGINTGSSSFAPTDPGTLYVNMGAGATDDVVFDVSSGRLRMTTGGGTPVNITTDDVRIESLTFTDNSSASDGSNITVHLEVAFNSPSDASPEFQYSYTLDTSVTVRN